LLQEKIVSVVKSKAIVVKNVFFMIFFND